MACLWLFDFIKSERLNARLFTQQFVLCLVWRVLTRPPNTVPGVVVLRPSLSLIGNECECEPCYAGDPNLMCVLISSQSL